MRKIKFYKRVGIKHYKYSKKQAQTNSLQKFLFNFVKKTETIL